jgi:undecaprenyl-diphosphatase
MNWLEVIVLAIVQGLTEFIPISSTAHLRIVPALFGWPDPGAAFTAVIQVGTLAAVVSYYWRDIVRIFAAMIADLRRGTLATTQDSLHGWMIAVGTVPIVILGLLFRHQIKSELRSLYVVASAVAGVAVLLAIAELIMRRREAAGKHGRGMDELGWRDAGVVGFAQAVALIPGASRSGSTILGGLMSGLSRETAARFSFLLSIPSVFAAAAFEVFEAREQLFASARGTVQLVVAIVVAGAVGYATIPWLLAYLRKRSTFVFIVYRLLLAALLFYLLFSRGLAATS